MTSADLPGEITGLLKAHHAGDLLSATGLVHEVYLQLVRETGVAWRDRSHFFAICVRAMRRTLVDYSRPRTAGRARAWLQKELGPAAPGSEGAP